MQLGSGGAVISLPAVGTKQSHAKGPVILAAQKTIDWPIIYSFFTENLVLSEEFWYKFKIVK